MFKVNLTFSEMRKTRNRCFQEVKSVMTTKPENLVFWSADSVTVWGRALGHWGKEMLKKQGKL